MNTTFKNELIAELYRYHKTLDDIDYASVFWTDWGRRNRLFLLVKRPDSEIKYHEDYETFAYDSGFGCQEVFGYIVFKDGSWFERHEYDGSEWWEYKEKPTVDEVFNTYFDRIAL